jgi:hypothetical protein
LSHNIHQKLHTNEKQYIIKNLIFIVMKINFLQIIQGGNAAKSVSRSARFIPMLILLLAISFATKANPIDVRTARQVGAKFIKTNTAIRVASDQDLQLVTTYRTSNGTAAFHVFNMSDGWVIVAADNCATPILGYSETGHFEEDNLPPAMEGYLMGFVEQIEYGIESRLPVLDTVVHQWELVQATGLLKDDRSTTAVTPLLTTEWGQGYNGYQYNICCPTDSNGPNGHAITGCVATAMGQIMCYWHYPQTGSGSHSYTPSNYPSQPQTVNFGNTTYDWNNMPNFLNPSSTAAQNNAVAKLLWHCGVSVNMDYGPNSSGAVTNLAANALSTYFNYSPDLHYDSRSDYTDSQWINKLKADLNNGRPILYRGRNPDNSSGHAFVCDGYNSSNQLHFNWGWYGNYQDTYFALDALTPGSHDYSGYNGAIFDIYPSCTSGTTYQVTATASPNNGGTISGTGSYGCGSSCTLTATPSNGYTFCSWTEGGVVVSTEPTYSFTVLESRNLVANFYQTSGATCTLVFTLYDSYGDGWNGNALVVSYSSGCLNNEELTFDNGSSATFTRNVVNGSHIVLSWTTGNWTDECSFSISYENGDIIYEGSNLSSNFSYEFDVNCGGSTPTYYTISASANPTNGGTVNGAGSYASGTTCTLTATANTGYNFTYWTQNGTTVSADPNYTFTVTENANYVANFVGVTPPTPPTPTLQVIAEYYPDANDPNSQYVRVHWSEGGEGSEFSYDFENSNMDPFTTIDNGNPTGYGWRLGSTRLGTGYGHNGSLDCVISESYDNNYGVIYPDNYLISEQVNITNGSTFSFWACAQDNNYPAEHFGVFVSLASNTYPSDFQEVQSWTITARDAGATTEFTRSGNRAQSTWVQYSVDLSNFVGTGYIAIRHYNCSDQFYLVVDDIELTNGNRDRSTYSIYRANCNGSQQTLIANNVTGNEYIDAAWSGLASGNYKYGVSVVDVRGNASEIQWAEPVNVNTQVQPLSQEAAEAMGIELCPNANAGHPVGNEASNREMWDLLTTFYAAEGGQYGVVTDGQYIYTSNWGYSAAANNFYKYDMDGNMVEGFNISGCGTLRGMTFDGQYVYGVANSSTIYCVDLNNHTLVNTFTSAYGAMRGITYDPQRDGFWVIGNWSGNLTLIDRTGAIVTTGPEPNSASDLAYYKDENNVEHVYCFDNGTNLVWDYDIAANSIVGSVFDFNNTPGATGTSGGCHVAEYNGIMAFFGDIQQSPNLIGIYELGGSGSDITWSNCIEKTNDVEYYAIITTSNPTEGGTVSGGGSFTYGQTCTLTATANLGYEFVYWTRNGVMVGEYYEPEYSFTVTEPANFVAHFEQIDYYIYTTAEPEEGGQLTGEGTYHYGDQVTLTATANPGYQFVKWTKWGYGGYIDISTSPTYTFTVNDQTANGGDETEYVAHFEAVAPPTLQVVAEYYPDATNPYSSSVKVSWGTEPIADGFEVQIGTGTSTTGYFPFYTLYNYSISENLFLASELEAAGVTTAPMSSLSWYATNAPGYEQQGISIWMANVSDEELTTTSHTVGGMTLVYTGAMTPEIGWNEFVFNQGNFAWDGSSNVLIFCQRNNGAWNSTVNWQAGNVDFNAMTYLYQDSAAYDVTVANTMYTSANRPNIIMKASGTRTDNTAYSVYRANCDGSEVTMIADNVTGNQYIDQTWANLTEGDYKYGVEILDAISVETFWSNCLTKSNETFIINAVADPAEGGTVAGQGLYYYGHTCTLTATANPGYECAYWTKDGVMVGEYYEPTYSFTVTESANYVAHFEQIDYYIYTTADPEEGGEMTGEGTYHYGDQVTLTATPNEGYQFINWTFENVVVSTNATYTFTVNNQTAYGGDETEYVAHFSQGPRQITVSANPVNGGTVTGGGTYAYGQTCTLTATANLGYEFVYWTQNGVMVGEYYEPTYSFTVTESANYVAHFEQIDYYIYTTADPEEGGEMTGEGSYHYGDQVTLTATPNEGYQFINWTFENVVVSTNATYTFTVNNQTAYGGDETEYVAHFSHAPRQITVSANPVNGGTVTGGGTYAYGQTCTLTATANPGYEFVYWTQNGVMVGEYYEPEYTFTVLENANFVAHFEQIDYYIYTTADPEEGGQLTGEGNYHYGDQVTLTATPNEGYQFVKWAKWGYGGYIDVSTSPTYTFTVNDQTANGGDETEYVAHFSHAPRQITVSANPVNGGNVTGGGTYAYGQTCTLTATANPGYEFVYWTQNGVMVGEYYEPEYSFTVLENANFVAHFEQIEYYPWFTINPDEGGQAEIVGNGTVHYGDQVTIIATPNMGYNFVNWTVWGEVLSTDPTYTFTMNDSFLPGLSSSSGEIEFIANFEPSNLTQTSNFTSGWNWYSTYIEQTGIDGLQILENGLGTNGIQIKSQQQYVNYYEGMGWMGMLSNINNESSYKIKANAACVVEMVGTETTSAAHPITIGSGWNWIGYPVSTGMSVATAFSNIMPTSGDQVKGQDGYANYYDGMGWMGTLSTITPGMGLLYKSNSSGNFTLVYPTNAKGETLAENITSENNYWVPDMHAYPDNMTVTAVVELDDNELQSDSYELAAFANGECRGSVRLMHIEPLSRHIAFLTVAGEEVETLTFSLYDTQTGEEIHGANEQINFSNNATLGDIMEPYVIHFRGMTGMDEWANDLNVYPNPVAKGQLFSLVSTKDEIGEMQIEIINALGVVESVRTTAAQTIAAPDVAGVYTLRITVEDKGTFYRKLVVR